MGNDERRRFERHTVERAIRVEADGQEFAAVSADLSAGGMALKGLPAGAHGARLTIAIEGLGEVKGSIVRRGETLGVVFDVSAEEQEMLAADILRILKNAMPV